MSCFPHVAPEPFFLLPVCTDKAEFSFLRPVLPSKLPPEKLWEKNTILSNLSFTSK